MSTGSNRVILWGAVIAIVAIIGIFVYVLLFQKEDAPDPFMPPQAVVVDAVKGEFQRYCKHVEDKPLERIDALKDKNLNFPEGTVFCHRQWLVPDKVAVWWGINPKFITYTRTKVAEPNAFLDVEYDAWTVTEPLSEGLEPKVEKSHCKRSIFLAKESDGWHYQGTEQPINTTEY